MSELFDPVLAAGPVCAELTDLAWLRAMLDAEAALAGAGADAGVVPRAHADRIAATCAHGSFDIAALGHAAAGSGNPAAPLVRAITEQAGDAGGSVHLGATSQDIVDTALMLLAVRALRPLTADLAAVARRLAGLAETHADTVLAGRTLLQQATPVTFGLTAAGWLAGITAAAENLAGWQPAAQLGGATGTLASLGAAGPAVLAAFSHRLGLAEPALPWHTERTRIAGLAGALATTAGAVAGIARNLTLLAQTEVAEVSEQGPAGSGGSSTMPHKRNPVAAISALACAGQAPGLAATLFAAMAQEHQRAAGGWHAEWRPFTELLRSTGSAVHWLRTSLDRLQVHPDAMRANLDITRGALLSERVTTALAPETGRLAAHDAVTAATRRALDGEGELVELLAADPLVAKHLDRDRLTALLDPAQYTGSAAAFIDRALTAYRNSTAAKGEA